MSLKTFLAINVQNIDTKVSAWGITQGWVLTGAFSFFLPEGQVTVYKFGLLIE